jgi:hypothetical protein
MNANEVAKLAQNIYDERIKSLVEPKHCGKALVIDVQSGDYEVDRNEDTAFQKLASRRRGGVFYVMSIGSPASLFVGGSV